MTLGKLVRALRDSMGLTQTQMAEICEVSDVYVSYIERGRRVADIHYGSDFYWKLARMASPESDDKQKHLYAQLVLAALHYRYPEAVELCMSYLKEALKERESNV